MEGVSDERFDPGGFGGGNETEPKATFIPLIKMCSVCKYALRILISLIVFYSDAKSLVRSDHLHGNESTSLQGHSAAGRRTVKTYMVVLRFTFL